MKTVTITAPEGYEFDQIKDGDIIFKEKKKRIVTYEDVAIELFQGKTTVYASSNGTASAWNTHRVDCCIASNNATSSRQVEKLMAINKLMNVAKWLNPKGDKGKYAMHINDQGCVEAILNSHSYGLPIFVDPPTAVRAVQILGENVIKLALTQDY